METLEKNERTSNRAGIPALTAQAGAAHPFAAEDIAHLLRWRFGEFFRAPSQLKGLVQLRFLELLCADLASWRRDSTLAYVASKDRATAALDALILKIERAALGVPLDARDADIREHARAQADRLRVFSMLPFAGRADARALLARKCRRLGVEPPCDDPDRKSYVEHGPAIARMIDPRWWRRRYRAHHYRSLGAAYRELGCISAGRELYVSDATLRGRRAMLEANARAAEAIVLEGERSARRITLAQAIASSPSNPDIRAAELMARAGGMNTWAEEAGFVCLFVTLTAPSRMHRRIAPGRGAPFDNPRFDPEWSAPRDIQRRYFAPLWARVRAELARLKLRTFGARSVEPHHDGTVHWHLLVWVLPEREGELREVIQRHALIDSPDEPGARAHRCSFEIIPAKDATRYIAKYVLELARADDLRISPALAAQADSTRANAWSWEAGLRRYQLFGVPEIGVARELRRVPMLVHGMPNPDLVQAPQLLRDALLALQRVTQIDALSGEVIVLKPVQFEHYYTAQGGCGGRRADRPLRIYRELADKPNRYGEAVREPIGVEANAPRYRFSDAGELVAEPVRMLLASDRERWRVVSLAVAVVSERRAAARSWTRDNNCTVCDGHHTPQSERGPPPAAVAGAELAPIDRLDAELARACERMREGHRFTWYWPRSGVRSLRPLTDDERADAAALAADVARLGPIPA